MGMVSAGLTFTSTKFYKNEKTTINQPISWMPVSGIHPNGIFNRTCFKSGR
jgi:hypothetical protein